MIELLEHRRLFNGTVRVIVEGNLVRVGGDAAGNAVALFRPDNGSGDPQEGLRVATPPRTRLIVNGEVIPTGASGSTAALLPTNGTRLVVDLGDGEDYLMLESHPLFGNTVIRLGGGNDTLTANAQFANLHVEGGDGDDRMTFINGGPLSTGNVALFPGAGRDRIHFNSLGATYRIGGKLWIDDRQGPLGLVATRLSVGRETVIATGNSIDRLTLTDSFFNRDAILDTRGGDDVIDLMGTVFRGRNTVLPGTGNNSVTGA